MGKNQIFEFFKNSFKFFKAKTDWDDGWDSDQEAGVDTACHNGHWDNFLGECICFSGYELSGKFSNFQFRWHFQY